MNFVRTSLSILSNLNLTMQMLQCKPAQQDLQINFYFPAFSDEPQVKTILEVEMEWKNKWWEKLCSDSLIDLPVIYYCWLCKTKFCNVFGKISVNLGLSFTGPEWLYWCWWFVVQWRKLTENLRSGEIETQHMVTRFKLALQKILIHWRDLNRKNETAAF